MDELRHEVLVRLANGQFRVVAGDGERLCGRGHGPDGRHIDWAADRWLPRLGRFLVQRPPALMEPR